MEITEDPTTVSEFISPDQVQPEVEEEQCTIFNNQPLNFAPHDPTGARKGR